MKLTKRIVAAIAMLVVLSSFISVSAYNDSCVVSHNVGVSYEDFYVYHYFDDDKGIIWAEYSAYLTNEAAIKVFHTTKKHMGMVTADGRSDTTREGDPGEWTNRVDIRIEGNAVAQYYAYY